MLKLGLADHRILLIADLAEVEELLGFRRDDFALLLCGPDADSPTMARVLTAALEHGCLDYSTVGPGAEQLHDSIDDLLVAHDQLGVLTTWNSPGPDAIADACWYFIHLAGPDAPILIAAIGDDPALRRGLEAAMADPP